jgi:hypothetical protein
MARPFRWHYTRADLNNYLQTPRRMTPDELTAVTTKRRPPTGNHECTGTPTAVLLWGQYRQA